MCVCDTTEFPFTKHNLASKIAKKSVVFACICDLQCFFFCPFSFYYYLISTINFCLISIFAEMPFKLHVCVKNGRKGS